MTKSTFSTWSTWSTTPLLLLLLVAFAENPTAQAQDVTEYVTVDSLRVGDTFTYNITLRKNREYDSILFPDSTHFGEMFEIRSRQHYRETNFKDSLVYRVQYFGTADTRIPALPIRLISGTDTTTVRTNPVPVYFSSVLQSENEEFRPLKPIFDFARAWWAYILGAILLALLSWYLYRLYQQKSAEPEVEPRADFSPAPFMDPLVQLENSLKQLRSFSFEEEEDVKQFYINLGDAIRTYFETLYHIPALESTSREIILELEKRMVDERMITQTRKVLRQADMVKFAKFKPSEEQTRISLSIAQDFVEVARKNDGPRIEQMRRQHQSEIEEQRRKYEEESETKELHNA
ncbi:hypothetical protein ACG2F4_14140 [Halalkalibaculum sp. DA3122]|uniref:hypothetical protein n=1 Tax=Halalkalibaculum sp. DA3122 TaxID=3373607 RepID=UPI00375402E9